MEEDNKLTKRKRLSVVLGAGFLMATSAIGPSFLTQTALFTEQYGSNFGFAILISLLMSIVIQILIWRTIGISGYRMHEIGNMVLPGLGNLITFLIAAGCLIFNIGNVAGAGLGLNVIFGINPKIGTVIAIALAIAIFLYKNSSGAIDKMAQMLGAVMIFLVVFIAIKVNPPMDKVMSGTFMPKILPLLPMLTIVGGTVGGYHPFAGAHRVLEANISGRENLKSIDRSASTGIIVTAIIRTFLFLAAFGVVSMGVTLDPDNPASTVFQTGAGKIGYIFFGIVLFSASLTSIVGATYTSISFLATTFKKVGDKVSLSSVIFVLISGIVYLLLGRPVTLMILTGALNGLVLPITLGTILIASGKKKIVGEYQHPKLLYILGVIAEIAMIIIAFRSLSSIKNLF